MYSPFDENVQFSPESSLSSLPETANFGQDYHNNSHFDDSYSCTQTYQVDQHMSQDQQHWNDAAFHSAPEHSLTQDIDSLLNGSDSSDDSNNPNTTNLTMPTFQHHAHYHPPHEHFHTPHVWEQEHGVHHALSMPESLGTHHTFHSSLDVNVSGSVNHRHYWDKSDGSGSGGGDSNSSSYSNAPSPDNSSYCIDSNGDGVCDSGSGSCGDGGSCGSDSN